MFKHFICGAYDRRDEDGRRKSRKNSFRKSVGRKKEHKNPYSERGLDKFSALLDELEEKKQKIYSEVGSQDISLIRFAYRNSTDIVPIVVRLEDNQEEAKKKGADTNTNTTTNANKDHVPVMQVVDSESEVIDKYTIKIEGTKHVIKKISSGLQSVTNRNTRKRFAWNLELHQWKRPSYYVPSIIVLILLLLVFFGRSVSILFTCIAWYLVPVMQGMNYNKKKGYVRKLSHNETGVVRESRRVVSDSGSMIKKTI